MKQQIAWKTQGGRSGLMRPQFASPLLKLGKIVARPAKRKAAKSPLLLTIIVSRFEVRADDEEIFHREIGIRRISLDCVERIQVAFEDKKLPDLGAVQHAKSELPPLANTCLNRI